VALRSIGLYIELLGFRDGSCFGVYTGFIVF